ncbi:MAG: hypothetical protein K9H61_02400 [Bacteroidia bacterium]|nr:hypothetical protein [Bacteroidia bacterium]MCF8427177.1 hypothetical protein [Bacteroidia bacterium]MCF8445822.1 hypothetical protein [Bacteroidia bacterium]
MEPQLDQIFLWKLIAIAAVLLMFVMVGYILITFHDRFREGYFHGIDTVHERLVKMPRVTRFTVDCEINKIVEEKVSDPEEKSKILEHLELNKFENVL